MSRNSLRMFAVCLVLAVLFLVTNTGWAQGDFFWSLNGLHSGATNSAAEESLRVGETGSLFLYYSIDNSEIDTGAGLDITSTNPGVIEFTAAETFDFNTCLGSAGNIITCNVTIDTRWFNGFAGAAQNVETDEITGLNAFRVLGGFGLVESQLGPTFIDTGYDVGAEAFLFGRVEFTATELGTTNLETIAGSIGIVNNGQTVNPIFGDAVINVVPEPSLGVVLMLLGISSVSRRSRK